MFTARIRRAALLTALLLAASAAYAKCAFRTYELHVRVRSLCSRQAIQGAQVLLFENDEETAVDLRQQDGAPRDQLIADASGIATARFWFGTYSGPGIFFADRCTRRLKKLTVVAAAAGHYSRRLQIHVGSHAPQLNDSALQLDTATIDLRPVDDTACYAPCGPPDEPGTSATGRLTPRCSGQQPGVRPVVAAELIRR
jgi:hypothetical protein